MTKLEKRAIELVTLRQGIKGRDLIIPLAAEFDNFTNDQIVTQLIELVAMGELVEIEYNLPASTYGAAISRSFLMPKGTSININKVSYK